MMLQIDRAEDPPPKLGTALLSFTNIVCDKHHQSFYILAKHAIFSGLQTLVPSDNVTRHIFKSGFASHANDERRKRGLVMLSSPPCNACLGY